MRVRFSPLHFVLVFAAVFAFAFAPASEAKEITTKWGNYEVLQGGGAAGAYWDAAKFSYGLVIGKENESRMFFMDTALHITYMVNIDVDALTVTYQMQKQGKPYVDYPAQQLVPTGNGNALKATWKDTGVTFETWMDKNEVMHHTFSDARTGCTYAVTSDEEKGRGRATITRP